MEILVVGDCFDDQDFGVTASRAVPGGFPDDFDIDRSAQRVGGAAVVAERLAALDHRVTLLTGWPHAQLEALGELNSTIEVLPIDVRRKVPVRQRYVDLASGEPILQVNRSYWPKFGPQDYGEWPKVAGSFDGVVVTNSGGVVRLFSDELEQLLNSAVVGSRVWDPHWSDTLPVTTTDVLTPSLSELLPGAVWPRDLVEISSKCRDVLRSGAAKSIVVTLGEYGLLYFNERHVPMWAPAKVVHSCDPAGTGDYAAAAILDRLLHEVSLTNALHDLNEEISGHLLTHGSARASAAYPLTYRPRLIESPTPVADSAKVGLVAAGGCFDPLHPGHLDLLRHADALGSRLDVVLSSDEIVRSLKGAGRPLQAQSTRVEFVDRLSWVDRIDIADQRSPTQYIETHKPAIWIKGPDYAERDMPETEIVRRNGGEVLVLLTRRMGSSSDQGR